MRTTIDTGRAGRALAAPGMDPRVWVTLAIITDRGVDPQTGVYVDIKTIPAGDEDTCVVGSGYVGNGYGAWLPLRVDDLVVIGYPRGDSGMGPVVLQRLWSGSDKPPAELGGDGAEPPDEPVIVIGEGQTARIICRPGASVTVTAAGGQIALDSPDVRLGTAEPTEAAVFGDELIDNLLAGATVATGMGPSGPLIPAAGNAAPWSSAKSARVKVG